MPAVSFKNSVPLTNDPQRHAAVQTYVVPRRGHLHAPAGTYDSQGADYQRITSFPRHMFTDISADLLTTTSKAALGGQ